MASLAGIAYRLRIILAALTRRNADLPIPIQDSTYYDAVRVAGDGAGVPSASADLFTILEPYLSEGAVHEKSARVEKFERLCRDMRNDKNACEPDVGRLLYQLVRMVKPECAIEVGVYKGAASCHIAQALKDNGTKSEFHLVDISEQFLEETRRQLEEFQLVDRAVFHCADAEEIAKGGGLPEAAIIFLDAQNTEEAVHRYLASFLPLVRRGGLLLLHNTVLWNGARVQANRLALAMPGEVMTLATSGGSGISIVKKGGFSPR